MNTINLRIKENAPRPQAPSGSTITYVAYDDGVPITENSSYEEKQQVRGEGYNIAEAVGRLVLKNREKFGVSIRY